MRARPKPAISPVSDPVKASVLVGTVVVVVGAMVVVVVVAGTVVVVVVPLAA